MGKGVQLAVVLAAVALVACIFDTSAQHDPVNLPEHVSKGQAVLGAQATTQQGSAAPEQQHLPKPHKHRALEQQGNEGNGGDDGSEGQHGCILHAALLMQLLLHGGQHSGNLQPL